MDLTLIITAIISALSSGILVSLLTVKLVRKKMQAEIHQVNAGTHFADIENFQKKITAYNFMIEDLDSKLVKSVAECNKLRKELTIIKAAYENMRAEYQELKIKYDEKDSN